MNLRTLTTYELVNYIQSENLISDAIVAELTERLDEVDLLNREIEDLKDTIEEAQSKLQSIVQLLEI